MTALVAPTAITRVDTKLSTARVRQIASAIVSALRRGDNRAALDAAHAKRGGAADSDFSTRLISAIADEARRHGENGKRLLAHFSSAERTLFDAYLSNPGGRARPEDLAFLAVDGAGTGLEVLLRIYEDASLRAGGDPATYRAEIARFENAYAMRYARRRGGKSLDQDLTSGVFSELSSAESVRYRAARAHARDALLAVQEPRLLLAMCEKNLSRLAAFGDEYGYVAQGVDGLGLGALRTALAKDEASFERALVLLNTKLDSETRAILSIEASTRAYLHGALSADDVVASLANLVPDAVSAATLSMRLSPAALNVLVRAKDPILRALGHELGENQLFGDAYALAIVHRMLEERSGDTLALAHQLDGLSPEARKQLFLKVPDLDERLQARGRDVSERVALLDAAHARRDVIALLHASVRDRARAEDLHGALEAMPAHERRELPRRYDARYGRGAFLRDVEGLPVESARALRFMLDASQSPSAAGRDKLATRLRTWLEEQRGGDDVLGAISSRLNDTFGFCGPVVDDALRDVVAAIERMRASDPSSAAKRARELVLAHHHFTGALVDYFEEREQLADDALEWAALVSAVVFTIASGGQAACIKMLQLAALATATGATAAAIRGPDSTLSALMFDVVTALL